ncbi:MAG: GNAT family N-acetyltransferase [Anaerolineae bacterium]|nr:GNAT family N-acetyltransferase [Anaerolineae bacterium]
MPIRPARPADAEALAPLVAAFRVALAALRGGERLPDLEAARAEITDWFTDDRYPVFVAPAADALAGYLVCRVEDGVVWAEQLYIDPAWRRRGFAGALYAEAERLAESLGGDTVYNWVHPNNDAIIALLRRRGYTVLNLVEVRRPREGEHPAGTIQVGQHTFDY